MTSPSFIPYLKYSINPDVLDKAYSFYLNRRPSAVIRYNLHHMLIALYL